MSLFSRRLFVNLGTSEYGHGIRRQFERSTAAHNTLELNNESSSEVWSGFRVGRRARIFDLKVTSNIETCLLEGKHDGYRYLRGRPIHSRSITLRADSLEVDTMEQSRYEGKIRFHLHPDIELHLGTDNVREIAFS